MRDLYHNVLATQYLNPVVATTTKTSTTIDLQGYSGASVVFAVGQSGDTLSTSLYWTLTLQHSDDGVSFSAPAAADLNSPNLSVVLNATNLDKTAYTFGYQGAKRYLQAVATPTGTIASGVPIGVIALRGKAAYSPVV